MIPKRHDPKFSFGGQDLSPYLFAYEVTRSILPSRNLAQTTVLGRNGALVKDEGLATLEIVVKAVIKARREHDIAEARRRVSSLLYSTGEQKLVLYDEKSRYYNAFYQGGAELDREYRNPKLELTFLCADPIAFGQGRKQTITAAQTVVNTGGTFKSYPTITAKPASGLKQWTITNVTTGEFVTVSASFTGSQTLILDMEKQRATINGSDVAVDINSDFFALDGVQKLKTSNGSATVEWIERWL